jgi:hypothetical protein
MRYHDREAYSVHSLRVCASTQQQFNHLHMTILSGLNEGGGSSLRETEKVRKFMRYYHRDTYIVRSIRIGASI